MWSGVSEISKSVDTAFIIVLSTCIALFLLVNFLMVYFVVKYNNKRHPQAKQMEGNLLLEITWTVIPIILVLGMFYYGWIGFGLMYDIPKDAMEIKVYGRMWSWEYEYASGKRSSLLNVPLGKPVKLILKSMDVTHSFYIPAFRIKQDVVPGKETYTWFNATEPGTYDVLCAEYCGLLHSNMFSKVVVMPEKEFYEWYGEKTMNTQEQESTTQTKDINRLPGYEIMKNKGCMVCHSTDGSIRLAPSFKGLYGKKVTVVTDGKERTITVDENYLEKSILDPMADIVPGYVPTMPSQQGTSTKKEIKLIIEYIKALK